MLFRDDNEKAKDSIRSNNESDSKTTSESDLHQEKQYAPSVSTRRGIIIVGRDDDEKADDSICFNNESDSKITSVFR
jgi:hypothetical protein